MSSSDQNNEIRRARYVSLATFRKSGAQVATPVWCAAVDDDLYIFSESRAGKIKRLRNSNRARMAVCDVRGGSLGAWVEASAEILHDPVDIERALAALRDKYGVQMWLADTAARLTGRFHKRTYIRVRLLESAADAN